MTRVVGLLGAKGAGKDTLAQFLVSRLGFVRASFADTLYREVAEAYGVTVEFLGNRGTKELPLPELSLANCGDENFVTIALRTLHAAESEIELELQKPRSPRWTLQLWGTEYRRQSEFGYDAYWVDKVRALITDNPDVRYVLSDVRFRNEVAMVRGFGGILIRVRRPVLEEKEAAARAQGAGTALHPSETELAGYPVDFEAINREGEPESLVEGLHTVLPELAQAA